MSGKTEEQKQGSPYNVAQVGSAAFALGMLVRANGILAEVAYLDGSHGMVLRAKGDMVFMQARFPAGLKFKLFEQVVVVVASGNTEYLTVRGVQ